MEHAVKIGRPNLTKKWSFALTIDEKNYKIYIVSLEWVPYHMELEKENVNYFKEKLAIWWIARKNQMVEMFQQFIESARRYFKRSVLFPQN